MEQVYKKFTKEQHIKKHTRRENTYCGECEFCNPKDKKIWNGRSF